MNLAKSNGLKIENHSEIVKEYSLKLLYRIANSKETAERFSDVVKYASLFHDIGKLTIQFQKYLMGKTNKPGLKFRHNEIGWAFLSKYLSEDFLSLENREMLLNIVYWHHGISNKISKHTDVEILSSLDEASINNMLSYLENCEYLDSDCINKNPDLSFASNSPLFYPDDKILKRHRPILNLLRSIVITADRNSSDFLKVEEVTDNLIDNYFNMNEKIEVLKTKFDGTERFNKQKEIVELIKSGRVTIIKAPTGFGKSLIGVLWGFKLDGKVIWVLPGNDVASNIYDSIMDELENVNVSTSIQLILGGEIVKTNSEDLKMYESNIIVTNIDNFLSPNFKNNIMNVSGLLFGANLIFDEFHELANSAPYFSLFIDIMRARNIFTNSSTLLLSATPTNCHRLWELGPIKKDCDTIILPSKETHFEPIHEKPYCVSHHYDKELKPKHNSSTLCIKNTVRSAQNEKLINDYEMLIHSNFTDEDKKFLFEKLLSEYGKHSHVGDKPNVVGTHVLQASYDISFKNLIEDVLSPEFTVQRFGRVNRWGELEYATVHIIKHISRSESMIKKILYSNKLSDIWFDYLINKLKEKKYITLKELYKIYNQFYIDNNEIIYQHFKETLLVSESYLCKIYPIKLDVEKEKTEVKTAGSNKLRSVNSEIFFIVQHENGKDWVGPFSKQMIKGFDEEFNESGNVKDRMIKTMMKLRSVEDKRFDFNKIIDGEKYNTIDAIRKFALKSNTPYIVYDRYYSNEFGVVKKKK
jgi:CRISPR-associated endonuclease Cas3-HD